MPKVDPILKQGILIYVCIFILLLGYCCVCVCTASQEAEEQTKSLEDLEFQKLEKEMNQDEDKESESQELLREIAECQRLTVTRKVRRVRFCECACSMYCMFNIAGRAGIASL